jgi:hypothetical protein
MRIIGGGIMFFTVISSTMVMAWGPFEGQWCSTRSDTSCKTEAYDPNTGGVSCSKTVYSGCKDCGDGYWYCDAPPEGDSSCISTPYTGFNVCAFSFQTGCNCSCDTAGAPSSSATGCTN